LFNYGCICWLRAPAKLLAIFTLSVGALRSNKPFRVLRWPPKIRREIGEWLAGALCGHGSRMSKPAQLRWRYFLKKLEAQNAKRSHGAENL